MAAISRSTPADCIAPVVSITRRSDGARITATTNIQYTELKDYEGSNFQCCCELVVPWEEKNIGWIFFHISSDKQYPVEILYITSPMNAFYSGVGTELVNMVIKCSRVFSNGMVKVYSESDAASFYKKMGFDLNWDEYKELSAEDRKSLLGTYEKILSKTEKIPKCIHMILSKNTV